MIPAPRRSQLPARRRSGWDSHALPIPRHFHVARSMLSVLPRAWTAGPTRRRGEGSQVRGLVGAPGAAGKGICGAGRLASRSRRRPASPPAPAPRLPNHGAARERAAANQERRERRRAQSEPESLEPASALRPGGSVARAARPGGYPAAREAGFAAATFRRTPGTLRTAAQVTAPTPRSRRRARPPRGAPQVERAGGGGRGAGRPRGPSAAVPPGAPEPAWSSHAEARRFHQPRASRGGRGRGDSA